MNTFKRLFTTVLIMLTMPSFAVWGQVLDLGNGTANAKQFFNDGPPEWYSTDWYTENTGVLAWLQKFKQPALPASLTTYTQGPAAVSTDHAFYGGVLMPNGKVCLVPNTSDYVGIYDPVAGEIPKLDLLSPWLNKF
jgi:hypothetical protein